MDRRLLWASLLAFAQLGCGREEPPKNRDSEVPASAHGATDAAERPRATFQSPGKADVAFSLEVASTPAATQRGLMYRKHLALDRGMLFIFSDQKVRSFWMKNTLIPLDIIFIDEEWVVVGVSENAVPQTLDSRTVGIPSKYVIEINGGLAAKHGIAAGSRVVVENVEDLRGADDSGDDDEP